MRASCARWRAADCRAPGLLSVNAAQPGNLGIRPGDDLAGRQVPRAAVALGTQVRGLPGIFVMSWAVLSARSPQLLRPFVTVAQAGDGAWLRPRSVPARRTVGSCRSGAVRC